LKKIFFNIVIPTKNRASTLPLTIKTLINQNYGDYKIVVADNNSTDNTEAIVKEMNNEKIIYTNSNKDISMSENWERGLDLVDNGYVTILGDDDAFVPNSLNILNEFISKNSANIVSWLPNTYFWPDFPSDNKNKLILYHFSRKVEFIKFSSSNILKQILDMQTIYLESPMIYNSFINIELIKSIKKIKNKNIFFTNGIPDVYSGLTFLLHTKYFYRLNQPIGINGISKYSGGALLSKMNKSRNEIIKNHELADIRSVPAIPSYYLALLDPFFKLCEEFKDETKKYLVNFYFLNSRVIKEIQNENYDDKKIYLSELKDFIKKLKDKYNQKQKIKILMSLFSLKKYETSISIEINQSENIKNIYDISKCIEKSFNDNKYKKYKIYEKIINFIKQIRIYNILYTIRNINKIF
tara:strand:- start:456 stop:1685 length:1230 start_codon:yes stop_codon:yes gene_type:complete